MNTRIEREVARVLDVVTHARNVFGGDAAPAKLPVFAARRDLEDDLGRGHFLR